MSKRKRKKTIELIQKEFAKQKYLSQRALPGCHDFVVVLDHLKPNFNIGKIFRSGFVFGVREIHIVGTPYFDPGPAKGALKYIPTKFFSTFQESLLQLQEQNYEIFVFESAGSKNLVNISFPRKSAFILGNEGLGISTNAKGTGTSISIPQFSKMESLNVSVAASIAMYEYVRQHSFPVHSTNSLSQEILQGS